MQSQFQEFQNLLHEAFNDEFTTQCAAVLAEMCDPYVPYRTGALAENITVDARGVTYNQPYAEKVYNGVGIVFRKEMHPLATAKWDEVMLQDHQDEFEARIKEIAIDRVRSVMRNGR